MPDDAWIVPLPADVTEPFEVFVNGVLQEPGVDYTAFAGALRFSKPLAREGRLGLLRWASMFFGVAGTYRKNDSVDVVYEVGGRRVVASGSDHPARRARTAPVELTATAVGTSATPYLRASSGRCETSTVTTSRPPSGSAARGSCSRCRAGA